jgi:aminopeptidase N
LIEGLNRYLPVVLSGAGDPAGTPIRKLLVDARGDLKPVEGAGPIWLGMRLVASVSPDAYSAVYGKGVWIIHMLRMMLRQGEPNPDAKFLAMLQELVQAYDGKAVSTWDFKRVAEKYAGQKLDWFFDQWVFATGVPTYSADYKIEASGNEFVLEGKITQTGVPDGFVMPVPVFADSESLGSVQVGDSEEPFRFRLNKKPERILIDPQMTILTSTSQ